MPTPTTPTPACQRRDRQRHLQAAQPAQGAITGANAKLIFIQANGSRERDYWCRHMSCTPVVGAGAPHYPSTHISLIYCVSGRSDWLPFFLTMPMSTRSPSKKHLDCLWLTATGFPGNRSCKSVTTAVTSVMRAWTEVKPGSLIRLSILQECLLISALLSHVVCRLRLHPLSHSSRLFSLCVNGISELCLLRVCVVCSLSRYPWCRGCFVVKVLPVIGSVRMLLDAFPLISHLHPKHFYTSPLL